MNKKIIKIEEIDYDDYTYSLNVEKNHNYFLENDVLSKNSLIIGDEFQNSTWKQTMMFMTRMDKNSKVIINGDVSQYDIDKQLVSLLGVKKMLSDIDGVGIFEFTKEDIRRHPILIEITDRYEKLKYSGKIKEER